MSWLRCVRVWLLLACSVQLACSAHDSADDASVVSISGSTMGTTWSLSWVSAQGQRQRQGADDASMPDTVIANDGVGAAARGANSLKPEGEVASVRSAAETELARINGLMSTWDPESELSRFNQSGSIEPQFLHADILQVIDVALTISRLTGGRYDITLQPVIDLWGFNRNISTPSPDDSALQRARQATGYGKLVRVGQSIRKRGADVAVDVSSLAKGFAVDKLGEVVESLGIERYVVDIGGEVRARGTRADGKHWQVGIESPQGEVAQLISLADAQIATSGSYRNYRVENGKRLSHIIDGMTGRPIEHDLVSVSVVHENTMLADAWATALLVVGEAAAQQLMHEQGLSAQLTVYRNGQFKRFASEGFLALVEKLDS